MDESLNPLPSEGTESLLRRLIDPGLKEEHLHQAIKAGEGDRRNCTKDDPKNAPGSRDYFMRMRTLRQVLRKELGWRRYDLDGLPLVINPDKTRAIGVVQGDSATGNPQRHPKTRKPVGEIKQLLVAQNLVQPQTALFEVPGAPVAETKLSDEQLAHLQTWFLLTCRTSRKDTVTVRTELSCAIDVDGEGRANLWKPRIFLAPLHFEGVIPHIEGTDDGPDEFDVEVGDL
ncbi:hypothetical protein [Actinomadura sp. NPDC000929]|uniref:hypothetical protein n=1 Tax=Actinomadura sp. NPDC000929 TaxID=3154517 RepID=UPI003397BC21